MTPGEFAALLARQREQYRRDCILPATICAILANVNGAKTEPSDFIPLTPTPEEAREKIKRELLKFT